MVENHTCERARYLCSFVSLLGHSPGRSPHHRRKNNLRTNANRPVKSALRVHPAMKPLQRDQRLMRMQTVNELQGIRQHCCKGPQDDDCECCSRGKQADCERQPRTSIKTYEANILE